jgi:outer membrane protein
MNKLVCLLLSITSVCVAIAQPSKKVMLLSLNEAVELGLRNRLDVQMKQQDVMLAENDLVRLRAYRLPEIKAIVDTRYNTQLPVTVLPEGFGSGNGSREQQFGTKNNTTAAITLEQPLIEPTARTEFKIATKNLEIENSRLQQTKLEVRLAIMEAYYSMLLKKHDREVAQQSHKRSEEYLRVAEGKNTAGTLLDNDLFKVKRDRNAAWLKLKVAEQQYEISASELKKSLHLESDGIDLTLTDSLYIVEEEAVSEMANAASYLVSIRHEVLQKQLQEEIYDLQIKRAGKNSLPSLSLYGNYSQQYQQDDFRYSASQWTSFNYVGLKFTLPILSQWQNRLEAKEFQLQASKQRLDIVREEEQLTFELQQQHAEMQNAFNNYLIAKENAVLSRKIYNTDMDRFAKGTLLYSSLLDSEQSLQESANSLTKSIYDYLVAKARWQKACGIFNN